VGLKKAHKAKQDLDILGKNRLQNHFSLCLQDQLWAQRVWEQFTCIQVCDSICVL